MTTDRLDDQLIVDVLVHPIRQQNERRALFDGQRLVVDVEPSCRAQRTTEKALLVRNPDAMVVRELLERLALHPVDACIPDMEEMRLGRLEDQGAERTDVAFVSFVAELAAL